MEFRDCLGDDESILLRVRHFMVKSWTLDERQAAVASDEFYKSVSKNLGTCQVWADTNDATKAESSMNTRDVMVEEKYYYAGGSGRYMFDYDIKAVLKKISDSINMFDIDRLRALFSLPGTNTQVFAVISRYAAALIALHYWKEQIQLFRSPFSSNINAHQDNSKLDIAFYTRLRTEKLAVLNDAGQEITSWGPCHVAEWYSIPMTLHSEATWIKPTQWNVGGFDAIMLCKLDFCVCFVVVTSELQQPFHIKHFSEWIEKFMRSSVGFRVKKLEIFFVVEANCFSDFHIYPVSGKGLLSAFGWPEGEEVERAQIVGLRG
ncbi:hypothetical protein PHYPSEUDO_005514 [Phytophthora pseudosyringae]|uniref:Crinkler (CRN) family protein n=1 Tax=Phytophthora pseudosyringae TaxID=221518 RepID=A0A8T1VNS0_9STRA|nr:hypothetical protein PHYPSEUDO_005514 [Phytophthora pseudosyringae]